MNSIEELTSKARIERLKSKFEVAKSYGSDQLTVPMPDLEALMAQLEAAQKEIDTLKVWKKIAAGRYENLQEIKSQLEKAEAALSAANEKHGWIKSSDQMPEPNRQRRECVFTPHHAADLRYRLVPANLFKAVCSSASHWHYVNDPVEGE
ncbi:hypothetical protein ACQ26C_004366 [Yersinia enterocolitica]